MEVLLLCTGNQCRSPMAEALLRRELARRGLSDEVSVRSAGLFEGGRPVPDEGQMAMTALGIDVTEHRSRQLGLDDVQRADLIVGMAREHVREAAVLDPEAFPKAFTLRELVRRGEEVGPRASGQPLEEWLAKVHAGRTTGDLLGSDGADDIPDPIGRPQKLYDQVAGELAQLASRMSELVWP